MRLSLDFETERKKISSERLRMMLYSKIFQEYFLNFKFCIICKLW